MLSVAALAGLDAELPARPLMPGGIVAGIVFGVGAGLNGACSFSTLTRLAEGHGVMLPTLVGWVLGLLAVKGAASLPQGVSALATLPGWLFVPGIARILWEGWRLARRVRQRGRGILTDDLWSSRRCFGSRKVGPWRDLPEVFGNWNTVFKRLGIG